MASLPWTKKEEKKLQKLYPVTSTRKLPEHFPGRSYDAVRSRATLLGLKKANGWGSRFKWTAEHDAYLISHYPNNSIEVLVDHLGCSSCAIYTRANAKGIKKSKDYMKRQGKIWGEKLKVYGEKTRFRKGQESWNKGKKVKEFISPEGIKRMSKTWFKKGNSPHNEKFDGALTIRRDKASGIDYLYIRRSRGEWQLYGRYCWEKETGEKLTSDHVIRFKDGNQFNCDISNLEKITMAENMLINTFSDSGVVKRFMGVKDPEIQKQLIEHYPELIELARNNAKLKIQINK